MEIVSSTEGSSTRTGWKRRSSAASFSMYLRYSSSVVAPMQCSSPRASIGLSRFPASIDPSVFPAPTTVCSSSMKSTISPAASWTSLSTALRRSSNSPRNFAPAISAPMSSDTTFLFFSPSGTSPRTMRSARPSTMAVFPTPGSPISTGLFLVRRESTWITRRISSSRPITGSSFSADASAVRSRPPWDPVVFLALVTTTVGLLFKISAAPFHMWAPDAYEGAPTTVTAYLSVASGAASFAFLLRLFHGPLAPFASAHEVWEPMLAVIAVLTLTVGNLAAVNQTNIKRLLAYSSISHSGYMLLGLVAGNETGINGIAVYVMVYTFMNLGAFLVLVALRRQKIIGEDLDDISGLMHKSPGYAVLMLIC